MIADISDASPQGIKDVLLVIGFLIGIGGGLMALLRKPVPVPQPMVTQRSPEWASAAGVQKLASEVDDLRKELHSQRDAIHRDLRIAVDAISAAGEKRAIDIHNRIEPLSQCIHTQAGTLAEITRLVHDINTRLPRDARKG